MLTGARRGASLIEILAALLIVGILAAALYPTLVAQLRRGQGAAVAGQLANLRDAINAYRDNVQRYPRTVSQLANALGVTATDACFGVMSAAIRNRWRGPYLTTAVNGDFPVGDGTVKDTLVRVPATDAITAAGSLQVLVFNVDSTTAADLERQFDGTVNFAAGTILWSSAGSDTLKFQILIRNC